VQTLSFALFVYLLFAALQRYEPLTYADAFFRFDPLAALATMIAGRQWIQPLALALVTVAASVALGRVWCGWVCPLGTLLEWFSFAGARRRARRLPHGLRKVKYLLLAVILTMAALGSLTLMVLDPLSLLTRTATTVLIPALAHGVTAVESFLLRWPALEPAVSWTDRVLRGTVLPVIEPRFGQMLALTIVFALVLGLGLLAERFWCRYLCPLGALLGLLAKAAVLRPVVGPACDRCGRCATACRLGAIDLPPAGEPARGDDAPSTDAARASDVGPGDRALVVTSECTMCLDCLVACPKPDALGFGRARGAGPWRAYDPGRRAFVGAAAAGVGATLLLAAGVRPAHPSPSLLRPPGSQDEDRFLSLCLRCTECMKVCPTSGLQPALMEGGLQALWTPILVPRLGACDYGCNACGQTCPSGAIPPLTLDDKRARVLGIAVIDRDRCLPWAQDTPCIVCQEMCPVPDKAIELDEGRYVPSPSGGENWVTRPKVVVERCIGCGICEFKCPVTGTSAIVVERGSPRVARTSATAG
jgi:polyferredoxin